MQSYAINQVQVLVTFVPVRLFVFSALANISNSNEEANTFLLVVIFTDICSPTFYLKLPFYDHFEGTSAPSSVLAY